MSTKERGGANSPAHAGSSSAESAAPTQNTEGTASIGFFERYLSLWVAACIAAGVLIGQFIPAVPAFLDTLEYANVSIPVAILIWLMIYPMMLKVDFSSIADAAKRPKGLTITTVTNWLIKPFTMYAIAYLFLKVLFAPWIGEELGTEYLAGAVLLGAAPCTAMVFVWSHLSDGDPAYTLIQVAVNDIIILFAFTPIVAFLLGVSNVSVPYDTLLLSVLLFVVIPFGAGYLSRVTITKRRGIDYFENVFIKKFDGVTVVGLLLTLIILFSFQGEIILSNPLHIALIAVPLVLQTFLIFGVAYGWARAWRVPHSIAGPGAMIGASNFFELAVAVAISLFGLSSGAALATVVGVLVEVPVMLTLVRIANATRRFFPAMEGAA
ncbi:MAG: ACR3 family arsenite efflux transporter [Spirochaetota bacterium]